MSDPLNTDMQGIIAHYVASPPAGPVAESAKLACCVQRLQESGVTLEELRQCLWPPGMHRVSWPNVIFALRQRRRARWAAVREQWRDNFGEPDQPTPPIDPASDMTWEGCPHTTD